MKKRIFTLIVIAVLVFCTAACAQAAPEAETVWTAKLTAHCADVPEGQELMRNRTLYHGQINTKTLEFLLQRKGGTLEEYIEFSVLQVLPFTSEEEKRVQDTMEWIEQMLGSHGLKLPAPGPLTFVKTTCEEELGAPDTPARASFF